MGARRIRREQRQQDMRRSRIENGLRKRKERVRRDERMKELLRKADYPYTPALTSWLSEKLNKPGRSITREDAQKVLGA